MRASESPRGSPRHTLPRCAFDSLVRQATVPHADGLSDAGCPGQCVGQRPNPAQYFAAQDVCHCWGGAAESLEDAVAYSALAEWAELPGRETETRAMAIASRRSSCASVMTAAGIVAAFLAVPAERRSLGSVAPPFSAVGSPRPPIGVSR